MVLRPYSPPSYSQPGNPLAIASAAPWIFQPDRHNFVDIQREAEQLAAQELLNQQRETQLQEDALRKQAYGDYLNKNPQGDSGDFYGDIADVLASAGLGEDSIKMREKGEDRSYRNAYKTMQGMSAANNMPPGPQRDEFLRSIGIDPATVPAPQTQYQITSRGIFAKTPGQKPVLEEAFPEKKGKTTYDDFVNIFNPLGPGAKVERGNDDIAYQAQQQGFVPKSRYDMARKMNEDGDDNVLEPEERDALMKAMGIKVLGKVKLKSTDRKDQ